MLKSIFKKIVYDQHWILELRGTQANKLTSLQIKKNGGRERPSDLDSTFWTVMATHRAGETGLLPPGPLSFHVIWALLGATPKKQLSRSSHCGSAVKNPTSIYEDSGLIPGLTQWVKDPALP